jgi:transcriptional regulator with XRE-family HTH domain
MENYRKIVGRNIRAARKELGWSQEDLAFETDIDRTYISGIERGVRNPSLDYAGQAGEYAEEDAGDAAGEIV